jgi:2,4-diaminopentanoate dehydrogenase
MLVIIKRSFSTEAIMAAELRVVHYGLGPIGLEAARVVARRAGMVSVAAVDIDPAKVGRDLADLAGGNVPRGVIVHSSLAEALSEAPADVALHTTGSYLARVQPELEELLRAGLSVASTCEELSYPVAERRPIGASLDALARQHGVAIIGAGINPGFAMDALPIFLTSVSQEVTAIRAKRVNDAGKRRLPLQRKVGAGLDKQEFQRLVDAGKVRHVGLRESVEMIADAMGWPLDDVEEKTSAVLAHERVTTDHLTVEPGQVAGVRQVGTGYVSGRPAITLELQMYVGARDVGDEVWIEGTPPLRARVETGFPGDITTAAILVNAARRIASIPPGLWTMKDLPPAHYRSA